MKHIADNFMNDAASTTSYATGISATVVGAVTFNHIVMAVGMFTAVGTFIVNWYYKHKTYKLNLAKNKEQANDE